MKGDGQMWAEFNKPVMDRLDQAIATAERGDDAYKRWPVDLLRLVRIRMNSMHDDEEPRKL